MGLYGRRGDWILGYRLHGAERASWESSGSKYRQSSSGLMLGLQLGKLW
jgi:hypothetical protein